MNIGISDEDRKAVVGGLSRVLADSYTVYLKIHGFHWNVKGPMFQALHNMFMDQYTEMWNALDEIAERILALGYPAPASYKQFAALSSVKEEEGDPPVAEEMIRKAVEGHEAIIRTAREVMAIAEKADDQVTVDLLTQRMQIHEKNAWMLRSFLEK